MGRGDILDENGFLPAQELRYFRVFFQRQLNVEILGVSKLQQHISFCDPVYPDNGAPADRHDVGNLPDRSGRGSPWGPALRR